MHLFWPLEMSSIYGYLKGQVIDGLQIPILVGGCKGSICRKCAIYFSTTVTVFCFHPYQVEKKRVPAKQPLLSISNFQSTLLLKPATVACNEVVFCWASLLHPAALHFFGHRVWSAWGHRYLRCSFRGHLLRRREGGSQNGGCSHRCPVTGYGW